MAQPQQYQSQSPQQETNVMAIVALVSAFVIAPVGLILGIVSLVQIKNNPNQKGKGLAIAAIIISSIGILLFVFMLIGFFAYFSLLRP
ncbi:MAG: DUF4190 domain-containing protein [Nanoarchaeota archaeon]